MLYSDIWLNQKGEYNFLFIDLKKKGCVWRQESSRRNSSEFVSVEVTLEGTLKSE